MAIVSLRTIFTIARHELRITLRNRWILLYAAMLAILTLAVSYFGLAVIEFTGFQDFSRTAVSLLNLVLYIVPLATMLLAVQSFKTEGGATDQLFAEPVTIAEIVVGKMSGLATAHVLAVLIGFSLTGAFIGSEVGLQGIRSYLLLLIFTISIGLVFLAVSTMLTVLSERGPKAYAVVLITWFALVLLFDFLIIGLSFLLPEIWANRVAFAAVFINPVDATRVATLLTISGREMFGPAGAQLVRNTGGIPQAVTLLSLSLLVWIIIPVLVAARSLLRQDL